MKKYLSLFLVLLMSLTLFVSCGGKVEKPVDLEDINKVSQNALKEEEACFNFFWNEQQIEEGNKGYGLIPDRYPDKALASIASVGFGLASFPIGVKNGWVTYDEAKDRVLKTLVSLEKLDHKEGFFYHFYAYRNGNPATNSEISNIDTAIMLMGGMVCAEYFGGEIKDAFYKLYDRVNWKWYINPKTNQFYMGYDPVKDQFSGAWDVYGEQLMMYFLAAGSRNSEYRIDKKVYDSFNKLLGAYGGELFIHSWFGSIFTYQFSHAFIDFRNIVDANGINWFENSVKATKAARQYAIDNSNKFYTYNENSWGITACDTPKGYNGLLGSAPSGGNNTAHKNEGTIALAGSVGSMPFLPKEVDKSLNYYYNLLDGELVGKYGLYDAYNLDYNTNRPWIAKDVIGIDKGISLLMIENQRSNFVWHYIMQNESIQNAINVLGFTNI